MSKRISLQLVVNDDSLVEDVIKPAMRGKRLNKLIVSLLKAYQVDPRVLETADYITEVGNRKTDNELLSSLLQMRESIDELKFNNSELRNINSEASDVFGDFLGSNNGLRSQSHDRFNGVNATGSQYNSSNQGFPTPEKYALGGTVSREEFDELKRGQDVILAMLERLSGVEVVKYSSHKGTSSDSPFNENYIKSYSNNKSSDLDSRFSEQEHNSVVSENKFAGLENKSSELDTTFSDLDSKNADVIHKSAQLETEIPEDDSELLDLGSQVADSLLESLGI